ncbi:sensor histidine kinase [Sorangium cellulosum]|uniref:histidine kinase n=1 Tax=Sorangium cellulosum TaxID=56 RepID=A0A4P2PZE3_SORCE|nr:ATP-binding protein [Sorangium cellulosum]AUX21976.1 sensor histidine kinase [Sorangium cellulosum]
MPAIANRRWLLAAVVLAALVLGGFGMRNALRWYERPFPGVLVDPDGVVSSIGLPSWEGFQKGLRFPDRIVEVNGWRLESTTGRYRASAWDAAVEQAAREGRRTLHARVETRDGLRDVELSLVPLDPLAWWFFAGGLMVVASLHVGAALVAMSASPRGKLARSFATTALLTALFQFALFDYHSSRALVPFFHVAYALVPMSVFIVALRLPDDAPLIARYPSCARLALGLGGLLAAGLLASHAMGGTTVALRGVCATLVVASFFFFSTTLIVRFALAEGDRRRKLRALLLAMAPPYLVIGSGFMLAMLGVSASTLAWFAIPALALTPVSTVVAFIRHDLWGSRALLSRPLTRVILGGMMVALTVILCTACAGYAGLPLLGALKVAAPAAVVSAALVVFALGAGDRTLFPARAEYKPTVEQLSEELTLVTDPDEVADAVERTVARWLPCERVTFRRVAVEAAEAGAAPGQPRVEAEESSGERPIERGQVEHDAGELSLTVMFRGRLLGVLEVGRKRGGALFTSEDLDLLRTIGNQAALALAHAHTYAELERRRREQAAAWRDERAALIETLAAEITHEVRYPINFFRSVFKRGSSGQRLDAEEVEIGCEEVERLERLVMGLRRVTHRKLDRRRLAVEELVSRAEMLLRDQLGKRRVEARVSAAARLLCDPDQATQVLVNLLSNGLDAAGDKGAIGVVWAPTKDGAELVVWDSGPGISGDPSRVFAPWYTTKPRGTGLGLAITHRIVRAHGWSINPERRDGRTRFVISIPAADVSMTAEHEVA